MKRTCFSSPFFFIKYSNTPSASSLASSILAFHELCADEPGSITRRTTTSSLSSRKESRSQSVALTEYSGERD
jgi:hypothetical protein